MKQKNRPVFVYPSVFAVALYSAVLGYMIPAMRLKFSLSLAAAGLFSTMQSIGFFIAMLLCFCVFAGLNKPRVMASLQLAFALCLAGLALAPSLWVLCVLFLFTGLFANAIDMLSNAVIADLAPDTKGRHIGLLQALFSAISAAAPFFALLLGGDYATVFFGLSALALASLALFVPGLHTEIRRPMLQCPQSLGTVRKAMRLWKVHGVPVAVVISFLALFVQLSLMYFLSSFTADISDAPLAGAFVLCMFYVGAMVGRLVFVRISRRINAYRIMAVYDALALAGIAAMLMVNDITVLGLLALIPGFGLSANFPGLMVEACNLVPDDTAAASALIFVGVNTAALAAPPLVGLMGDSLGLGAAFTVCGALLVPVIALSIWMGRKAQSAACCADASASSKEA